MSGTDSLGTRLAIERVHRLSSRPWLFVTGQLEGDALGIGDELTVLDGGAPSGRAVVRSIELHAAPSETTVAVAVDPRMITGWLRERIGQRLAGVIEGRYWNNGERDPDAASLIHAWLHFEHRPPTPLHGCGDDLQRSIADNSSREVIVGTHSGR